MPPPYYRQGKASADRGAASSAISRKVRVKFEDGSYKDMTEDEHADYLKTVNQFRQTARGHGRDEGWNTK